MDENNYKLGEFDFTKTPEYQKLIEMKMALDAQKQPSVDLEKMRSDYMTMKEGLPEAMKDYQTQLKTAKEDAVPAWKTALGAVAAGMQGMASGGQNLSLAGTLGQSWDKARSEAGKDLVNPQEAAKAKLEEYIKMKALGREDESLGLQKYKVGQEDEQFKQTMKLQKDKLEEEKRQYGIGDTFAGSKSQFDQKKLDLESGKIAAERQKALDKETKDRLENTIKSENDLRKEIEGNPETKQFIETRNMFNNIKTTAKSGTAAGDMSMIFSYMKMLDPGSTVREGEFANAQNSTGVPGQIQNLYNKAISGTRLNDQQRKEFVNEASNLYKTREQSIGGRYKFYEDIAKKQGLNIDNIIYNPNRNMGSSPTAPATGGSPWSKYPKNGG